MLDKIHVIDMVYDFKTLGVSYDYHQVGEFKISPDKKTIRFKLRKCDGAEDLEDFDNIIQEEHGEYFIKSEYFEDISEKYLLEVTKSDGELMFVQEGGEERMTIYAGLA
jgi:hypothetical protein